MKIHHRDMRISPTLAYLHPSRLRNHRSRCARVRPFHQAPVREPPLSARGPRSVRTRHEYYLQYQFHHKPAPSPSSRIEIRKQKIHQQEHLCRVFWFLSVRYARADSSVCRQCALSYILCLSNHTTVDSTLLFCRGRSARKPPP